LLCWFGTAPSGFAQQPSYTYPSVDKLPVIKGFPDPFRMHDGSRVATLNDWQQQRTYIKDMLLYYEYGYSPPGPNNLKVATGTTREILDGKAKETEVTLTFGPGHALSIKVLLAVPTSGKSPFPAVVTGDLGWYRCKGLAQAIARDYIVADFNRQQMDPDNKDRANGVHPLYPKYSWGTIAAWAWGFHRVTDYLLTLEIVDKKKIAVTGHSRGGKAALLAGALDERVAITAPNASGGGGSNSYRRVYDSNQSLQYMSTRYEYWFQPNLKLFSRNIDKLIFDQHFLFALVAPRPFIMTESTQDRWGSVRSAAQVLHAVRPVYEFLGADEKTAVMHVRPGGHSHNTVDWDAQLDFFDFIFFDRALPADFHDDVSPPDKDLKAWKAPATPENPVHVKGAKR
jgi:dienelactone hydrolase